jgi:Tfp pilus assembly protein PilF
LAIFQNLWGNGQNAANSLNTLAEIFCTQEDFTQAEPLLQQALHLQEQMLGSEHPETARSFYNLAVLSAARGDFQQARDDCARALAIRRQALLPEHPDLIATEQWYAQLVQSDEGKNPPLKREKSVEIVYPLA